MKRHKKKSDEPVRVFSHPVSSDPLIGKRVRIRAKTLSAYSGYTGVVENSVDDAGPARLDFAPGDPGFRVRLETEEGASGPSVLMFTRSELEEIVAESDPDVDW